MAKIIKSPNVEGIVLIPKSITYCDEEYIITDIDDEAFSDSNIEMLKFSEDSEIDSIGDSAFKNSAIKTICIPKNLQNVHEDWIQGAEHLQTIEINENNKYFSNIKDFISFQKQKIIFSPISISGDYIISKKISHIGGSSFYNREKLKSITTKAPTIQKIESYAFSKCPKLERVHIKGSSKLKLCLNCFSETNNLVNVELEGNDIFIDENSFNKCTLLETIKIKNVNKIEIYSRAFNECSKLKSFLIKNDDDIEPLNESDMIFKVQKIESIIIHKQCFTNCSSLTSIIFSNVENVELGQHSFRGCDNLDSIVIKDSSIIKIMSKCLSELKAIKSISFESKIISIENNFIENCQKLNKVSIKSNDDLIIPSDAFKGCISIKGIELNTKSKLQLNKNRFKGMKKLETIKFSFQSIENHQKCFKDCSSIENIYIDSKNDILLDNSFFKGCKSLEVLKVTCESSLCLTNQFMENSANLREVYLKSLNKIKIGCEVFKNCLSLKTFNIEESGKIHIGDKAFYNCESLSTMIIKECSDIKIGSKVFKKCISLKTFNIEESGKIVIGDEGFYNCESLSTMIIKECSDIKIGSKVFKKCISLKTFNIEESDNIYIGDEVFYNCKKLEKIKIESKKTEQIEKIHQISFGNKCFSNLKEIEIIGGDITISNDCLKYCSALQRITIDSADKIQIKENQLAKMDSLTKIKLRSNSSIRIEGQCLACSSKLKKISISGKNVFIGDKCFQNCSNLSQIKFKKMDDLELKSSVFSGCNNLLDIFIDASSQIKIGKECFKETKITKAIFSCNNYLICEDNCFEKCSSLTTFMIKNAETVDLCQYSFEGCIKLSNFIISKDQKPKSNNKIWDTTQNSSSFYVSKIESINIHTRCFMECSALAPSITFAEVKKIELHLESFCNCNSIFFIGIINSSNAIISNGCFSMLKSLESVTFEVNSISINNNFIYNCPSLSYISITSANDLNIPSCTFEVCKLIKGIELNTKLKLNLNKINFKGMEKLETIKFSFQSIENHQKCFEDCSSIENIYIKSKDDILLNNSFFTGCQSLKVLKVSCESSLWLANQFMEKSDKLREVYLNSKNIFIGNNCFSNCKSLSTMIIKESNEIEIGCEVFNNCISLTTFNIEESGKIHIGNGFSNCNKLKIIKISTKILNEIPTINFEQKCFSQLENLEKIEINGGNITICQDCLKNNSLKRIDFLNTRNVEINERQFSKMKLLDEININSINKIDLKSECFQYSKKLQKATFIGYEAVIGSSCFKSCSSLNSIEFKNVILELGQFAFANCNQISNLSIQASTITINDNCFKETQLTNLDFQCIGLTENTLIPLSQRDHSNEIPEEKIIIGVNSFSNCLLPDSISFLHAKNIVFKESSFSGCKNLKELTINAPIEFIAGKKCFDQCNQLSIIKVISGKVTIEEGCFQKCESLKEVSITSENEIILKEKAFCGCSKLNILKLTSKSNAIEIHNECFSKNTELANIYVNSKSITIKHKAFSNCKLLYLLNIINTENIELENCSFDGCENISQLIIFSAKKFHAHNKCFSNAKNLQSIDINCENVELDEYCFYECTSLQHVSIKNAHQISIYDTSFNKNNKILFDYNIEPQRKTTVTKQSSTFSYIGYF